jgi:hypothetical protein
MRKELPGNLISPPRVVFLYAWNVVFLNEAGAVNCRSTKTLEQRMSDRIARKKGDVFLRADFQDLGGYDQVGRALRKLVDRGTLVKLGYGLYARARVSPLSGKTIPKKNLPALATEALRKLNVEAEPSRYARAYDAGRTTQVPTGRVIAVKGRISRKIGYDGKYVSFERAS